MNDYPYYDRAGDRISYEQYKRLKADDEYRRVGLTNFPGGYVATSWMGSGPGGGDPRLVFETLVYGGPLDGLGDRYSTEGESAAGHDRWVAKVRAALAREAADDAKRPPLVLSRAMWRELQDMHAPTTVSDGAILRSGPCAVCKDPGEGNWCATYQWLVRVVTHGSKAGEEFARIEQAAGALVDELDGVAGTTVAGTDIWDDPGFRAAINEASAALNRKPVGEDVR